MPPRCKLPNVSLLPSSSRPQREAPPPKIKIINAHRTRYTELREGCRVRQTRYWNQQVLEELGLATDIDSMMGRIGWRDLYQMREPTSIKLTLEFASSFKFEDGRVSFRLVNNDFDLGLDQFASVLSLPPDEAREITTVGRRAGDFWNNITLGQKPWKAASCKATLILHPVFRVVQKFLAEVVFARADTGGDVSGPENLILRCMVYRVGPAGAYYIAEFLHRQCRKTSGTICFGGLVTFIARNLDRNLGGVDWMPELELLGYSFLKVMKLIVEKGPRTYWVKGGPSFRPWGPELTIENERNWVDNLRDEYVEEAAEEESEEDEEESQGEEEESEENEEGEEEERREEVAPMEQDELPESSGARERRRRRRRPTADEMWDFMREQTDTSAEIRTELRQISSYQRDSVAQLRCDLRQVHRDQREAFATLRAEQRESAAAFRRQQQEDASQHRREMRALSDSLREMNTRRSDEFTWLQAQWQHWYANGGQGPPPPPQ